MLGTNDATKWSQAQPTFEAEYRSLINTYLSQNGVEEVILVTSPPALENCKFSISNSNIKTYVNPIQRDVAKDLQLPLVDARAEFEKIQATNATQFNNFYRPNDGVHFSVSGAQFMAQLIEATIRTL